MTALPHHHHITLLLLSSCNAMPDSGHTKSIALHTARNPQKISPIPYNPLLWRLIISLLQKSAPHRLDAGHRENDPVHSDRTNPEYLLNIPIFELGSGLFSSGSSLILQNSKQLA